MDPTASGLQTFLAARDQRGQLGDLDLVEVGALGAAHPNRETNSSALPATSRHPLSICSISCSVIVVSLLATAMRFLLFGLVGGRCLDDRTGTPTCRCGKRFSSG